ncbi:hypothetical protein KL918_000274 [Ogataea parapolymorpha]|uniref:Secreted protein n=1 Tax=Ogataea parapolymorpha (strain ATCC 26012 / BCRC 20466 / JCM 22074 / NRRL Y-7560 / DL-1) TaxID=871575 RepID=W1Q8G4_OGAPD|nr:putative secreted protein [Ogataea parapolymorpha DL-1]ESW96322.1 putative secreted protein [Ogataea parapolymorpha DL-1]KAG7870070.1 hypothetical protein KL918_000274 [Ogataea parapolymorpha]KAG7875019.1 hypothetical protein KL916_000631 [Ogataea parapolymorpha]KAG7884967.1 hypothetical protein KL938_001224 [Ogataea parapolymorpha]
MQFVTVFLMAASAFAASTAVTESTTQTSVVSVTVTSCDSSVTDCPFSNSSAPVSTYEGGAPIHGSFYAAGAAALAAGAFLL